MCKKNFVVYIAMVMTLAACVATQPSATPSSSTPPSESGYMKIDSIEWKVTPVLHSKYPGIPPSAVKMAEDHICVIFTDVVKKNETEYSKLLGHDLVFGEKDVWLFDKRTNRADKILTTHADARCGWKTYSGESVKIHKDSIADVGRIDIVLNWEKKIIFLIQECTDHRNIYTYIVTVGKDSVVCLPTSGHLIGFSSEENLIIMESYVYYHDGGRYGRIQAFDSSGRMVSSMDAKRHDDPPFIE